MRSLCLARALLQAALLLPIAAVLTASSAFQQDDPEPAVRLHAEALFLAEEAYYREVPVAALIMSSVYGLSDAMDPMSMFVPADQVEFTRSAQNSGASSGSGALAFVEGGVLYVADVLAESPAARAGLEDFDVVTAINGRSTQSIPPWSVVQIFSGPMTSTIALEVARQSESLSLTLSPGPLPVPKVDYSEIDGESLIRIPQFSPQIVADLEDLLGQLSARRVDRILLDLRGASWGEPDLAFSAADLFTSGTLGSAVGRGEVLETFSGEPETAWQGRLVVLVDRSTLGVGELLTLILSDKVGAELVGEQTFGLAGRQEVIHLTDDDALILTTAFLTGPEGAPLNEGIAPDIEVARDPFGESSADLILEAGLIRIRDGAP